MTDEEDACDHSAMKQAIAQDRDVRPLPRDEALADLGSILESAARSPDIESQRVAAKALFDRAGALSRLGRFDEVDRTTEALRSLPATSHDAECRRWLCRCLFGAIGDRRRRHGKRDLEREIDDCEAVFELASSPPLLEEMAAEALYRMGTCGAYQPPGAPLTQRAHDAYRRLGRLFASSESPVVASFVASGMANLARTVWPESEEARAIWESVVAAYAHRPDPALQLHAAEALQAWALGLFRRKRDAEAIAVWDRSNVLFGASSDPKILAVLAGDLLNRAQAEGRLHDPAAELATYAELSRRFAGSPSPIVQRWVACAETNRALTLLDAGRRDEAAVVLRSLVARFEGMTEPAEIAAEVAKAKRTLERIARGPSR